VDDFRQILEHSHRELSPIDVQFRELAETDPVLSRRASYHELLRPNVLLVFPRQPWPTFTSVEKTREFVEISVGLSELIRSVPKRLVPYYGFALPPFFVELMLDPPNGIPEALSRADLIYTEDGFRLLEFNMASNIGGWEGRLLADLMLGIPEIRQFIDSTGKPFRFQDPLQHTLKYVLNAVENAGLAPGGDAINVVFGSMDPKIYPKEAIDFVQGEYQRALQELFPGRAGKFLVMHGFTHLQEKRGWLYEGDVRIHALIENRSVASTEPALFRCFKGGRLLLYNGPVSVILGDKRNLALISEREEDADTYSAEERELIRRHLPWTRRTVSGKVTYQGETVDLETLVRARRENMVLKQAFSSGGANVLLGRFAAPEEWEATMQKAFATGYWVVQEYAESKTYWYQHGEQGGAAHDLIWGPFVFGKQYGGSFLRVQPKSMTGIVNLSREASEGLLFEEVEAG
jgi:hypothetical protein